MEKNASFPGNNKHQFLALTTYRKSGIPVMTPVWFVQEGEKLYVWTATDSGKAKRLRKNPCVELGPSNHSGKLLGEVVEGMARFVPEDESPALAKAFKAKYGWQMGLFALIWKIKGQEHTYIEITPAGSGYAG